MCFFCSATASAAPMWYVRTFSTIIIIKKTILSCHILPNEIYLRFYTFKVHCTLLSLLLHCILWTHFLVCRFSRVTWHKYTKKKKYGGVSSSLFESTHKKEMTLPLLLIFTFYFHPQNFCTFPPPFQISYCRFSEKGQWTTHKGIILIFRHVGWVVVGIIIVIVINNECNAVQKWKLQFNSL